MTRAQQEEPQARVTGSRRTRFIITSLVTLLLLYLIGLINPVTGPALQYPYYELFAAESRLLLRPSMGRYYYTPDMQSY